MATLKDTFATELTHKDKGYESGSESFNVCTPLSAEHCKSTMSPWWEIYPSTLQTLDNHQQFQSSMQIPCLTDTEVTALPTANWCSPAQINKSPVRPSKCHNHYSSVNDGSHNPREADASSSVHHNLCHSVIPTPTANPILTSAWDNDTTSLQGKLPNSAIR